MVEKEGVRDIYKVRKMLHKGGSLLLRWKVHVAGT